MFTERTEKRHLIFVFVYPTTEAGAGFSESSDKKNKELTTNQLALFYEAEI